VRAHGQGARKFAKQNAKKFRGLPHEAPAKFPHSRIGKKVKGFHMRLVFVSFAEVSGRLMQL
jgi:hypothetical protein